MPEQKEPGYDPKTLEIIEYYMGIRPLEENLLLKIARDQQPMDQPPKDLGWLGQAKKATEFARAVGIAPNYAIKLREIKNNPTKYITPELQETLLKSEATKSFIKDIAQSSEIRKSLKDAGGTLFKEGGLFDDTGVQILTKALSNDTAASALQTIAAEYINPTLEPLNPLELTSVIMNEVIGEDKNFHSYLSTKGPEITNLAQNYITTRISKEAKQQTLPAFADTLKGYGLDGASTNDLLDGLLPELLNQPEITGKILNTINEKKPLLDTISLVLNETNKDPNLKQQLSTKGPLITETVQNYISTRVNTELEQQTTWDSMKDSPLETKKKFLKEVVEMPNDEINTNLKEHKPLPAFADTLKGYGLNKKSTNDILGDLLPELLKQSEKTGELLNSITAKKPGLEIAQSVVTMLEKNPTLLSKIKDNRTNFNEIQKTGFADSRWKSTISNIINIVQKNPNLSLSFVKNIALPAARGSAKLHNNVISPVSKVTDHAKNKSLRMLDDVIASGREIGKAITTSALNSAISSTNSKKSLLNKDSMTNKGSSNKENTPPESFVSKVRTGRTPLGKGRLQ